MANTFRIPLLNPSRWVQATATYDSRYNTKPFDDKTDEYGYKLPWQTDDTIYIQLYSDFSALTGNIYKFSPLYDKVPYSTFALTASDFTIVGVSFSVYEASIPLAGFPPGVYYAEISYVDQNGDTQVYRSCLWDVQANQSNTLLYEYSNSVNDKDIIFDTGIVFDLRLTAAINRYEPGSDDEQYNDQYYNTLNENSIPFRTFINEVSSAYNGVLPDWVIDKLNLIYSLNQVSIDGTYYNKFKGESFNLQRNAIGQNFDAMASIKIIPSDNLNLSKFTTTSPTGDDSIQVIVKDQTYVSKTTSWSLPGFTSWSELIGISFINSGEDAFTMQMGTTLGGTDIVPGGINITGDLTQSESIGHRFSGASTLYVTVPSGVNLTEIVLYWYQYDAATIEPPDTSTVWRFGALYEYIPRALNGFATAAAMLAAHWNLATGLGQTGTDYEGCQIDDITVGQVAVTWNRASYLANPSAPNLQIAANTGNAGNTIELTANQLPPHRHETDMFPNLAGAGRSIGGQGTGGTFGSYTSTVGNGDPVDISNDGYLVLKFYRVT